LNLFKVLVLVKMRMFLSSGGVRKQLGLLGSQCRGDPGRGGGASGLGHENLDLTKRSDVLTEQGQSKARNELNTQVEWIKCRKMYHEMYLVKVFHISVSRRRKSTERTVGKGVRAGFTEPEERTNDWRKQQAKRSTRKRYIKKENAGFSRHQVKTVSRQEP